MVDKVLFFYVNWDRRYISLVAYTTVTLNSPIFYVQKKKVKEVPQLQFLGLFTYLLEFSPNIFI